MTKYLAIAGLTLTLMPGLAYAQDNTDTSGGSNNADTTGADNPSTKSMLDDKAKMGAFYTDESMTTMKPAADFGTAFTAMTADDQAAMRKECENSTSQKDEFCQSIKNVPMQ